MIWQFINTIYNFIISLFNACEKIWNWTFTIGDLVVKFSDIITTSLIVVIGLMLVKKLIPVA